MRSQKLNLDKPSIERPTEAIDAAEARMRAALGLGSRPAASGPSHGGGAPAPSPSHDQTRPRRRFAQDGDVQVVMLGRSRETEAGESRAVSLTAELREEKSARGRAERALEEANLSIQSLKTKLAHLEIACEEKLNEERAARAQSETIRASEQEARKRAEIRAAETALALSIAERRIAELEAAAAATPAAAPVVVDLFGATEPVAAPRRPGRRKARLLASEPAVVEAESEAEPDAETQAGEEDKPIEWWLPSFRAQRTAATSRKRKTR